MITASPSDKRVLTKDLKEALVLFANGTMKEVEAEKVARKVMAHLDINNPVFAHKGPRWLARQILNN